VTDGPDPSLRIELLGGFNVTVHGHPVGSAEWTRRKPAGVVKLLARLHLGTAFIARS
jgi:hypothetical protein